MMPHLLKRFVFTGLPFFGVATSDLIAAQGIDEVVVRDLSGLTTGVVAALHHNGEGRGGSRFQAVLPDGRVAVRFDLLEGSTGRRFLYYTNLVYRHGDDPMNQ